MSDFWENMKEAFVSASSVDEYLNPEARKMNGPQFQSVRNLADTKRAKAALPLPVRAGTRVSFAVNLGSVLTYDDIPGHGVLGTVVTVKTGAGNTTALDGKVFVVWDDGKFRPIMAEHLRHSGVKSKRSSSFQMTVSGLGDLSDFFSVTGSVGPDELVHKATKDLWSYRKDGDQYVIERLFDDTGKPLKV